MSSNCKISSRSIRVRWDELGNYVTHTNNVQQDTGARLIAALVGQHCDRSSIVTSTSAYQTECHATVTFSRKDLAQAAYERIQKSKNDKHHFDNSFDGLTILQSPPSCDIDICGVHGLEGNAMDSFCGEVKLWLRDLLPATRPFNTARIMTFGYNSRLMENQTTAGMTDWADALLQAVGSVRTEPQCFDRPILFVAHSLGGLVTRRSMERLHQFTSLPDQYPGIRLRQCGILFLSTPHLGTVQADYGELFSQMMSSLTGLRKEAILRELQSFNNAAADSLDTWRVMQANGVRPPFECLSESKKTKFAKGALSREVVTSVAASFMEQRAMQLPNADHHQVCKYDNAYDQGFKTIIAKLSILRSKLLMPTRIETFQSSYSDRLPGQPNHTAFRYPLAKDKMSYFGPSLKHNRGHFSGRCNILADLQDAMDEKDNVDDATIVALSGIGGTGKTEILLEYGLRARENNHIFHLQALPGQTFESCVYKLAAVVGSEVLPPDVAISEREMVWASYNQDQRVTTFIQWLQSFSMGKCVVLVDDVDAFVDADDLASLSTALRAWPHMVLLTTRDPELGSSLAEDSHKGHTSYTVRDLSQDELEPVMRRFVSGGVEISGAALTKIAELMQGHAMAACLAVQFICRVLSLEIEESPVDHFIQSFEVESDLFELREQFLNYQPRLGRSLATCFETSIERLGSLEHISGRILNICAYLNVSGLDFRTFFRHPRPWFSAIAEEYFPGTRKIFEMSKVEFVQALHKLITTSAVTRAQDGKLALHRLMMEHLLHRQRHAGRIHVLRQVMLLCQASIILDEKKEIFKQFKANCESIARAFRIEEKDIAPPPAALQAIKQHSFQPSHTRQASLGSRLQNIDSRLRDLLAKRTADTDQHLSTEERRIQLVTETQRVAFEFEQICDSLPPNMPPAAVEIICLMCNNMSTLVEGTNPMYHDKLRQRIRRLEKSSVPPG